MDVDDTMPTSQEQMEPVRLRASDWLWRPWYAKLWWAAIPVYWAGRIVSERIAVLTDLYDTLVGRCLSFVCNPVVALVILGFGLARAKLNRAEWVITPGLTHMEGPFHIERRPGELLDPYTDFTDPRSGVRYLCHRGVLKDHNH